MAESKQKFLSEDQVLLILKALADRRRYEIVKRLNRSADAVACETVRGCMEITPPTLSHHMKELETAGLAQVVRESKFASYVLRRDVLELFLEGLRADLI